MLLGKYKYVGIASIEAKGGGMKVKLKVREWENEGLGR